MAEKIREKIIAEFSKIKSKKRVYAVISQPECCLEVNKEVIHLITKKLGYSALYVTLNNSHCSTLKYLGSKNIDTKKIFFIDNVEDEKGCGAKNCMFLGRNKSLTALSLAITEVVNENKIQSIFFDSVTTLLIYNNPETTERFIHFFVNKIKNAGILLVMVSVEDEKTKKIIPILSQLCDVVIKI